TRGSGMEETNSSAVCDCSLRTPRRAIILSMRWYQKLAEVRGAFCGCLRARVRWIVRHVMGIKGNARSNPTKTQQRAICRGERLSSRLSQRLNSSTVPRYLSCAQVRKLDWTLPVVVLRSERNFIWWLKSSL